MIVPNLTWFSSVILTTLATVVITIRLISSMVLPGVLSIARLTPGSIADHISLACVSLRLVKVALIIEYL
jgi:hypothetical protein